MHKTLLGLLFALSFAAPVQAAYPEKPIRFVIPRKSELFQADLFPDCRAPKAALKADEP